MEAKYLPVLLKTKHRKQGGGEITDRLMKLTLNLKPGEKKGAKKEMQQYRPVKMLESVQMSSSMEEDMSQEIHGVTITLSMYVCPMMVVLVCVEPAICHGEGLVCD